MSLDVLLCTVRTQTTTEKNEDLFLKLFLRIRKVGFCRYFFYFFFFLWEEGEFGREEREERERGKREEREREEKEEKIEGKGCNLEFENNVLLFQWNFKINKQIK